jgi:predicted nuclease of predicted toxin-antitoxin system
MMLAIEESRTIITYDSDYGELIFKYGYRPTAGVIFIRNQSAEPVETATIIGKLIMNTSITFEGALTVIDRNHIGQKRF